MNQRTSVPAWWCNYLLCTVLFNTSNVADNQDDSNWKSQIATSNFVRMGLRKPPYAFTENGVAMLSSVLRSPLAIQVNIGIQSKTKTKNWFYSK